MILALLLLTACGGGVDGDQAEGLVLNEVLAKNTVSNADEAGEFDDWVEIFNGGTEPISRAGLYLTDDSSMPVRWPLPEGAAIEPGEYLLFWCDGQPEQGELHTTFKLGGTGEMVGLTYYVTGEPLTLDTVDFGVQVADTAWARVPDGGLEWIAAAPTPGKTNGG